MGANYKVAIIGLGIIGQRMLTNMPNQGRLEIIGGWDLSPEACATAKEKFPWLTIAGDAQTLISDPATDLVYIGVPPKAHHEYALAAIDAGKAVFCEKPLGVDEAESLELTERMEASGLKQAVNFSLASARGVQTMRKAIASGEIGEIAGADIHLHFTQWPRGWQENATWLGRRDQGGFAREVLSHFIYLISDLFGGAELLDASIAYPNDPDGAETHLVARLDCAGRPVTVAGSVGGAGPDRIEFTLWGSRKSYRTTDFYRFWESDGGDWQNAMPDIENPGLDAYMLQLDELVAMLDGKAHCLPDFRAGLNVQKRIEAILASG